MSKHRFVSFVAIGKLLGVAGLLAGLLVATAPAAAAVYPEGCPEYPENAYSVSLFKDHLNTVPVVEFESVYICNDIPRRDVPERLRGTVSHWQVDGGHAIKRDMCLFDYQEGREVVLARMRYSSEGGRQDLSEFANDKADAVGLC